MLTWIDGIIRIEDRTLLRGRGSGCHKGDGNGGDVGAHHFTVSVTLIFFSLRFLNSARYVSSAAGGKSGGIPSRPWLRCSSRAARICSELRLRCPSLR